jgi:acyl-CoA thioester hydrolase
MDPEPEIVDAADPAVYRHWIEDHVRFADLDPLGHCNHAVISGFFESSRVALFAAAGNPILGGGLSFPIVRLVLEFRRELLLGTSVRIGARVVRLGRTSVTLGGAVFEAERCAATAEVVGVLIDLETRSSTELPSELRERLAIFG